MRSRAVGRASGTGASTLLYKNVENTKVRDPLLRRRVKYCWILHFFIMYR